MDGLKKAIITALEDRYNSQISEADATLKILEKDVRPPRRGRETSASAPHPQDGVELHPWRTCRQILDPQKIYLQ